MFREKISSPHTKFTSYAYTVGSINLVCGEDQFTTYQIYRSDGIGVAGKSGEIDWIAGVQALNTSGEMIRQISITRNSFTMVKMPPRSHRVIVTRAFAMSNNDSLTDKP